jgi:Uma2 family endonuclease
MEQRITEPRLMTVEEYLDFDEEQSEEKHEYFSGKVIAMAGGSPMHALIGMNVGTAIRSRLKGKTCRVFSSDLRVRIPNYPTYVYPDLSVVCGPLEYDARDKRGQTITNPALVVEVESPSTVERDWSSKLTRYVSLPSLQEYILVSQEEPQAHMLFRREEGSWLLTPFKGLGATMKLHGLDIDLPLTEIYAGVEFPPTV